MAKADSSPIMDRSLWDILVIGGGPAGAMAARAAVRAPGRHSVLLIEKDAFDREKPCGGGLTPKVLTEFGAILPEGVLARSIDRIRMITAAGLAVDLPLPAGKVGATVYRGRFDSHLVSCAQEAGACAVAHHTLVSLHPSRNRVGYTARITDAEQRLHTIHASMVIGCDGARSRIRRWCELDANRPDRIAVQYTQYYDFDKRVLDTRIGNAFEVYIGGGISETAYAWLFPKDCSVSVGVGALVSEVRSSKHRLRSRLEQLIGSHPVLSQKLSEGSMSYGTPSMIAYPGRCLRPYADHLLLAGDAAGHANMFSGEGIYYAMRAGQLAGDWAVAALTENNTSETFLAGYHDACERAFGAELAAGVDQRLAGGGLRNLELLVEQLKTTKKQAMRRSIMERLGW